jgi:hypothetical protein
MWTLRKVDQKYLESFECGAGEEWRSVGPTVRVVKKYNVESRRTEMSYIK